MRVLLDANVLLDCLILEASEMPRAGKAGSDRVFDACDQGVHVGLIAWHTLPIIAYYFDRQNSAADTNHKLTDKICLSPGATPRTLTPGARTLSPNAAFE